MTEEKYDLAILGGGAAAFAAAIKASELGAKVAMIESGTIGGTCVNVGCVLSKYLLTIGEKFYYSHKHQFKGVKEVPFRLNFSEVIVGKDELLVHLRKSKYSDVIEAFPNIDFIPERGEFVEKDTVKAGEKILKADKFIIATGSSSHILRLPGIEEVNYLTNVEALSLRELPQSMVILGGRALALEFAQMYAHFGTKVTVLQRSSHIIPEEEKEISEALRKYLEDEGIKIYTGVATKALRKEGNYQVVTAQIEEKEEEFKAEKLLMATGRKPNTSGLGLEKVGVEVDERTEAVIVNEELKTSASNVWAAGDVTGHMMLETVAGKEGSIAAQNALTANKVKMDLSAVPRAVFTLPQVASVGLTDKQANQQNYRCSCRVLSMSMVPKAAIIKDTRGLIKMVTDAGTKRVLGIHILSPLATEMIHEATLIVKHRLTVDDVIDTVHIFPTLSEAIKIVAQSFTKDISKLSCCVE